MDQIKILLAIPAYRCEKQIRRVLVNLAQMQIQLSEIKRVIVFDNQSPDLTFAFAGEQIRLDKKEDWISVMRNPVNVGLGGTHKIAFDWARNNSFSHVIFFHGDDQGDVADIPKIVEGLILGFDAVLGSRFMSGSQRVGYSLTRNLGNRLLNLVYSLLTLNQVSDLGSGLNGYRVAALDEKAYRTFSNQFTFNMDLLLSLISSHAKIKFIPITWREIDQISNASTFTVGWQALKTLLIWRLGLSHKNRIQNE